MGYRGRKQRPLGTVVATPEQPSLQHPERECQTSPVPFFSLTRVIGAVSLKSCHCQSCNYKTSKAFLTPHCRIIAYSILAEFNYYTRTQVFPGCKVTCLPREGCRAWAGEEEPGTCVSYGKEVAGLVFEADHQITGGAFHRKSLLCLQRTTGSAGTMQPPGEG